MVKYLSKEEKIMIEEIIRYDITCDACKKSLYYEDKLYTSRKAAQLEAKQIGWVQNKDGPLWCPHCAIALRDRDC